MTRRADEAARAVALLDSSPAFRARLVDRLCAQERLLHACGLAASGEFVRRVVRAVGPWVAAWWLRELLFVVMMKEFDSANGKPDDPVRFLRGHYRAPERIVLHQAAVRRPKVDEDVLIARAAAIADFWANARTAWLSRVELDELIGLYIALVWDRPVLARWLEPTRRAEEARLARRRAEKERARLDARGRAAQPRRLNQPSPRARGPHRKEI